MKRSDAFTTDIWTLYLRSIHDHAEFLIANPKTRNWLLAESNGLLAAGILFPEFKDAQEWVRIACERFEIEMMKQVHPDGGHVEYSSSYMLGCTRHFANALDIVDRNFGPERSFSQEYRERLVAMWEHVMYMLRPDGRLPMLNDSDWTVVADRLRTAGERYGRPDFVFAATNGAEGVPPANTSHRFPWTRRVITRLGADGTDAAAWKEDAFYGFFEAAPLGVGHLHEDLLTFELMAYGQPLTGTMGRYSYEQSPLWAYFRGGPAYNTVLVDRSPQNWRRADTGHRGWVDTYVNRSGRYATGPTELPWLSTQEQDTAYAVFDKTWADESLAGTIHERWFAFRKSVQPFWLVRDRLSGGDAVERELRTLFHLYPDAEIEMDGDTGIVVVTYPSGVGFVIAMSGPDAVSFDAAKGQKDPLRGWFSREYGIVEPAWEIAAVRRTVLPAHYVFAMVPFCNGKAPDVSVEETANGARVTIDDTVVAVAL